MRRRARRGNAMVELTLVGIPVVFALISIFELARGMWQYHTLAYAVKEGTRYAIVHGQGCAAAGCRKTIGDVAQQIRHRGVGLVPADVQLEFESKRGGVIRCTLSDCLTRTAASDVWPPAGSDSPGTEVTIRGTYRLRSMLVMMSPVGATGGGYIFDLPAASTELIQF